MNISLYDLSVWVLPLVIAITFHEAAHGFVAHRLGDDTAFQLGRVSFNPLKHIDPFGTVLLPGILLLSHAPFLFGFAKPVPVNFRNLNHPRLDMVWVALAGPATNILLAFFAALAFHALPLAPSSAAQWIADNLKNALLINIVLAVFNMLPIPPLDGGRVAVGLLPNILASPLSRLEPYGMLILIGFLIVLPLAGSQFGLNLDVISTILRTSTGYVLRLLLVITGNVAHQPPKRLEANLIKAADMMIARRADTKARADFATWKMLAKLNGTSSLPAEAQNFLAGYKALLEKMPEAEATETSINLVYRKYYAAMGGVGSAPDIKAHSNRSSTDNVTAFKRPPPERPRSGSGPETKPRLPVALIFACLVVVYVGLRYFWP